MPLELKVLTGDALARSLPDVAALRIKVFREWPYLYEGDHAYEERYLEPYVNTAGAVLVGAFEGAALVGAATGMPLTAHADDFAIAFVGSAYNPEDIFYCAESVLLPEYRGQGAGHRFFDLREEAARAQSFGLCAFCAVVRSPNHPARPNNYRALDGFWRARGYAPADRIVAEFSWKDIGESYETLKPLQFWIREL